MSSKYELYVHFQIKICPFETMHACPARTTVSSPITRIFASLHGAKTGKQSSLSSLTPPSSSVQALCGQSLHRVLGYAIHGVNSRSYLSALTHWQSLPSPSPCVLCLSSDARSKRSSALVRRIRSWRVEEEYPTCNRACLPAASCTTSAMSFHSTSRTQSAKGKHIWIRFLVDTGAQVSVIPPPANCSHDLSPTGLTSRQLTTQALPHLGNISSPWTWSYDASFVRCLLLQVTRAILGIDFPSHFHLLVDVNHCRLVETTTRLQVHRIATQVPSPFPTISHLIPQDMFSELLWEFPSLLCPPLLDQLVTYRVAHHILRKGPRFRHASGD